MKYYVLLFIFLVGCAVNSIRPSGGGLDLEIDLTGVDMRHGWTYFSKPANTEVIVRDEASIGRGKEIFKQHCQKCHGEKGVGNGPLAQALKIKPADLSKLPRSANHSYLLVQINQGKGSMPQWQDFLTKQQSIDVTNYIQELSSK